MVQILLHDPTSMIDQRTGILLKIDIGSGIDLVPPETSHYPTPRRHMTSLGRNELRKRHWSQCMIYDYNP